VSAAWAIRLVADEEQQSAHAADMLYCFTALLLY